MVVLDQLGNKVLHIMVGLPRSGKSTVAKELGYPVVEPDAIRKTLQCFPFNPSLEPLVWSTANLMVQSLFNAGHDDVILDAVNHTKKRRSIWDSSLWRIQYHRVSTDKDTCIQRAINTDQAYLVPIIERMWFNFEELDYEDC